MQYYVSSPEVIEHSSSQFPQPKVCSYEIAISTSVINGVDQTVGMTWAIKHQLFCIGMKSSLKGKLVECDDPWIYSGMLSIFAMR